MSKAGAVAETGSVAGLVGQVAGASPASVAVRDADGTEMTYGQLALRAERLAQRLRARGVTPGDLVGLCLERSAGLIVATLGIVQAGAAYVCMDPAYPDERLRWMLDDAGVAAVVTDAAIAPRIGGDDDSERPRVVLETDGELTDRTEDDGAPLPGPAGLDEVAYVVYTSGSTGQPKGVLLEHGGLRNLVDWHISAFGLSDADRCTQIASPGFDASVWEIWPSLAAGATIQIVPEALRRDPPALRDWLVAQGITVSFLPTAIADGVIALSWPSDGALRHLLAGGDALARRPRADLPYTVVNNYGLSEASVVSTSGVVSAEGDSVPSIGRAIDGVTLEIVDAQLHPVPAGAEGELVVGGISVGRGYLNRPELTAERFIDGPDGRRYRTGDRVRLRPDGELEFAGRGDDQLSIRGFRVEPGEVTTALTAHPGIAAGVAVGVGAEGPDPRLVAYVVAAAGEPPYRTDLEVFLGGLLPAHMVPSEYVWLDELPLTPHGKLDRDALPAPEPMHTAAGRAPETDLEAATAAVMAELLELDAIGMDENFFLLGGHSMLGGQLIVRLEDRFDVEVSLRYLFDNPTPAAIAAEVTRQIATAEPVTAA
jgi:amino acid adenylation domain-containing protein